MQKKFRSLLGHEKTYDDSYRGGKPGSYPAVFGKSWSRKRESVPGNS
ncbi:Uncharacterized protein BM_BM17837 [Brugia malayi]|uniref:Uncharacterized protein n=1 Tax=Brugia malayi TaxID=6279 RepID=A0A4E9FUF8_BRUMA|nr:Uncharacterized protein BM_BM17837 [Brugia malayi]VIO99511.1 Uncharacterized protein BM_BM17837 [Brugia malayi]